MYNVNAYTGEYPDPLPTKAGDTMEEAPATVVIVDDDLVSRGYMELFIKPSKSYRVAAALPFAADVLTWCRENGPPDLVLMDVMMADGVDGLTAAAGLKQRYPRTRIIIATSMADADWLDKARAAGIESFWFKTYPELPLLEIMDRTMAGEHVYPASAPGVSLGQLPASRLTKRQRQLLRCLVEGMTNREIGERMYLSPNTVKEYLDDLMEKSGLHTRTALVAQAARLGIVVSESDRLAGAGDR